LGAENQPPTHLLQKGQAIRPTRKTANEKSPYRPLQSDRATPTRPFHKAHKPTGRDKPAIFHRTRTARNLPSWSDRQMNGLEHQTPPASHSKGGRTRGKQGEEGPESGPRIPLCSCVALAPHTKIQKICTRNLTESGEYYRSRPDLPQVRSRNRLACRSSFPARRAGRSASWLHTRVVRWVWWLDGVLQGGQGPARSGFSFAWFGRDRVHKKKRRRRVHSGPFIPSSICCLRTEHPSARPVVPCPALVLCNASNIGTVQRG
jgi:hypothetical protein